MLVDFLWEIYKMNALQAIKTQLNVAHTENGDLAYKSTGSACLDFFSLCGGMRKNISDLDKLFAKAFAENPVIAIKILFYMRNIRGGLGERKSIELSELLPKEKAYYRFNGSLTTPPCTEGVRWLVLKESVMLSGSELQAIQQKMVFPNNRPVQKKNARIVVE